MYRVLIVLVCLVLIGCGGSPAAPATQAPAKDAPAVNVQATIDAAVKATTAAQPKPAEPTTAPKATDAPKTAPTTAPAPKATDVPKPAPTAVPPTPSPAAVGKVGEPIEVNGVRLTVHKAEKKGELSQFQKAKDARTFVVVEVTIENTGDKEHSANMFNFKVRDADGQQYNVTAGTQDALQLAKLVKGDKARGTVPFDVKADAKGLTLLYDTQPLPSAAQIIRVDLGLQ